MFAVTSDCPVLAAPARPRRILVVEDNADAADTLRVLLGRRGHEVRVARNGVEGIGVGRDWKPDVVLSDLGLPRLGGFAVAKALRPTGAKLIALSAYADADGSLAATHGGSPLPASVRDAGPT
jgi:CheY-like chemotaxis protein